MQLLSIRDYSNNPQGVQNKWDLALVFNLGADCHVLVHNEIVTNFTKIMVLLLAQRVFGVEALQSAWL